MEQEEPSAVRTGPELPELSLTEGRKTAPPPFPPLPTEAAVVIATVGGAGKKGSVIAGLKTIVVGALTRWRFAGMEEVV